MLVQSTSGLDYKICKLKENQKGRNICIDSDFVEFHPGTLTLLAEQRVCTVDDPEKRSLLPCDSLKDVVEVDKQFIMKSHGSFQVT